MSAKKQYMRKWLRKWRKWLKLLMGGRCWKCGSKRRLEFDCIEPRGHRHHRMSVIQRMMFYRREYTEGNLQLLCRACHLLKTTRENECNNDNHNEPAESYEELAGACA